MKNKISVAIATYNEENHIKDCLESVHSWVDEIVIVDGSSKDKTVDIAKKFKKVKVIVTTNKPIFHINKQIAIDECNGNWILQLDADERVPPLLKKEILPLLKKDPDSLPAAYWIKRKNLFLGHFFKKSGQYPDPVIRLFQKGKGKLPCKSAHEQIKVKGEVSWLQNDFLHFGNPTFSEYLKRFNRYTSLAAQELQKKNSPIGFFPFVKSIFQAHYAFFIRFFRCKGFLDGFPGFVFAFFSGLDYPVSYIKYYELTKQKREIDLAKDWD